MKKIILILCLGIFVNGCATVIPISPKETCAAQDMKLVGVDRMYVSTWSYGNGAGNSSGANVRCDVTSDAKEKFDIQKTKEIARPKFEYNSDYSTKRLLTGAGYYLVVIPGIVAKIIYDMKYDEAIERSNQIERNYVTPDQKEAGISK